MCGIAGKLDFTGGVVDRSLIERMCATIVHRGPDDQGIYTAPFVGLGQRRLAIIDLDHRSVAPLSNEDGTIWVTFNGEIYNFQELRADLITRGHVFLTEGDTEVIVHLYEEYGIDCLRYMRGMFAFALWDAPRRRIFAARDRLGKKPFVYARTPHGLTFGSEIKAVTADPEISVAPNYHAIDEYLTYQYVPSPLTAFEGIWKLPAAHYLLCGTDGVITTERYWDPPLSEKIRASQGEIEEELVRRLREAVRMRLISDVPVGAFLSGGIDSATVVALMAQQSSSPVRTFSIGFEDQAADELPYARLLAERYGTEHHELRVKPDTVAILPLLVHHFNEPFADSSAVPTYYVSKMTREHVTVALSGDGGDENFSGYQNYASLLAWARTDRIPLRAGAARGMTGVLDVLPDGSFTSRARRAAAMLGENLPGRFRTQTSILKPQERRAAYTSNFEGLLAGKPATTVMTEWNEEMDPIDWMSRHDQRFYLADCLMVKVDIASMANSLEVRCPMLDHELVEFAATIPSGMKRTPSGGKEILKRAVASLLPAEILAKRKTGFGIPLERWFRGPLAGMLREVLLSERAARRDLINQGFVRRLIDEQTTGRRNRGALLWALLFLELWFREFID